MFILREVFDTPHAEIAEAVGKSSAAVRQIATRAREHVAARRPRMDVTRAEQEAAVERFRAALVTGDVAGLLDVLAPDVVLIADGGGLVAAVRHPTERAERVAALLSGFARIARDAVATTVWVNGEPAVRIDLDGHVDTAVSVVVSAGRVARIYAHRNPQKLTRLGDETRLSRT